MVLKAEVVAAFDTLGLDPSVNQATASRVYKKLSLRHHPDRNLGDPSATAQFQKIGEAWLICQRHYDKPHLSEEGAKPYRAQTGGGSWTEDDDIPLDEEESASFFQYMFGEMMRGVFNRDRGQRYRHQRAGRDGDTVYTFSPGLAESQRRQKENSDRLAREKAEYEKRKRELEREIEAEEEEARRRAREYQREAAYIRAAYLHAFRSGRAGQSLAMKAEITHNKLDVNAREKASASRNNTQNSKSTSDCYETMLHVAATFCDVDTVRFLLDRGADPTAINQSKLNAFHLAILKGKIAIVRFLLRRDIQGPNVNYKSDAERDAFHPSKAAADGRTPLQLAIASSEPEMVGLFVKDATVHDVEMCWLMIQNKGPDKSKAPWVAIQSMLKTKKSFATSAMPTSMVDSEAPVSLKALRRQEKKANEDIEKAKKAKQLAEEQAKMVEKVKAKIARAEERRLLEDMAIAEEELRAQQAKEELRRNAEERARRLREDEKARLADEEARRELVRKEAYERITREAAERASKHKEEEERLKAEEQAKRLREEEKARREEEEEARREVARKEAYDYILRAATERANKEKEEAARMKAEEQARRLREEEKARREEVRQEAARKEAKAELEKAKKAKQVAEEQAKMVEEIQAKIAQAEERRLLQDIERAEEELRAHRAKKEELRRNAEERARRLREEEETRRKEEDARQEVLRKEAYDRILRAETERAKKEIEEAAMLKVAERELQERLKIEADEKARQQSEGFARRKAELQARKEAAEQALREAEESLKACREAEEKARREEEKARREAEEKARREAEEKACREAEKVRKEAEETARIAAEEKARKEVEEKERKAAEEIARIAAEKVAKRQTQEILQRELNELRDHRQIDGFERWKAEQKLREDERSRGDRQHKGAIRNPLQVSPVQAKTGQHHAPSAPPPMNHPRSVEESRRDANKSRGSRQRRKEQVTS